MKNSVVLAFIFVLFETQVYGQDLTDLIVTTEGDSIECKITLVNEYNIFYQYRPKKKKALIGTHIIRSSVVFFLVNDSSVTVLEEKEYIESAHNSTTNLQYIEENGIIYSEMYTTAPVYGTGLVQMYEFIESNTRVYPEDARMLGGLTYIVLFGIQLDSMGGVENVFLDEPVSSINFGYEALKLQSEFKRVLYELNPWSPALIDGKPVASLIYLPLKFYIDGNRVLLLPSQYSYSFKNRK